MNRELIAVIEQIGREKGIDKEILFEALESALLSASKKTSGAADNVRMHLDRHTGALRAYGRKRVVTEVTDPKLEISLADAKALNPAGIRLGVQEMTRVGMKEAEMEQIALLFKRCLLDKKPVGDEVKELRSRFQEVGYSFDGAK